MESNKHESLGLKEFIDLVREELMQNHDGTPPLLIVESVELEIRFTVTKNKSGGVDFKVLQAGAANASSHVQSLKLNLTPVVTSDEIRLNLSESDRANARKKLTRG